MEANEGFGFERLTTCTAGEEWTGVVDKPGLLRFVAAQSIIVDTVPRVLVPPGLVHLTPRLRRLIALRRRLMPFLPFLRP